MLTTTNPAAIKIVWEEGVRLLTSDGPHAIDEHAVRLRTFLPRHKVTRKSLSVS